MYRLEEIKYCPTYISAVLITILLGHNLVAQQPRLTKVDLPEGVPRGFVGNFGQDDQGYLWLGTRYGLHRYDGYKYESYYYDPEDRNSLGQNRILSMIVAKNGLIWLGLWSNGVDCFDPSTNTFTHFLHDPDDPNSLADNLVWTILEDHYGTIWLGTAKGLHRFNPEDSSFTRYQHIPGDPTSLSCDQVRILYEDHQGTLWVGTGSPFGNQSGPDDGGLNRFHPESGTFTRYMHDPEDPQTLLDNKVDAILEDERGIFWIGTKGDGLHTLDRNSGTFVRHRYDSLHPNKLSRAPIISRNGAERVSMLHEDNSGAIWIGTDGSGLSRYDPILKNIVHYTTNDTLNSIGLESNRMRSAYSTRDGEVWISTFGGAQNRGSYYKVDPSRPEFTYHHIGLPVWGIVRDQDDNLWIGTEKGLNIYTSGNKRNDLQKQLPARLDTMAIQSLMQDAKGMIWIGLDSELLRVNPNTWEFTSFLHDPHDSSSLGKGDIYPIYEDLEGIIWVGSSGNGLNRLDNQHGTFIHYQYDSADENSISAKYVATICEDHLGNLWVAGGPSSGLSRLDKKTGKFTRYLTRSQTGFVSTPAGLPNIVSIMVDSQGKIWAGGRIKSGLYFYDRNNDNFESYKDPETGKQLKVSITNIVEDSDGNIWIIQENGNVHKLDAHGRLLATFGKESEIGLRITEFSTSYIDKSGNIYYGDREGYYKFDPSEINGNLHPPIISFSDFRIFNEVISPGSKGPLTLPVDLSETIELAHNQNVFSIGFNAIHFKNPPENRILYMLEHRDRDWVNAGEERTASYFDLLPGEYVFRVKAANSDGVWGERQLTFIIHPPWWKTWWAYTVYGILFIAGVFAVDRIQRKRLLARERERTREKELAQAKEIEKAYTELKATQSQLIQSEKMASLGELTAGIAHEIQNPLNFVNNFSDLNAELIEELEQEVSRGNIDEVREITKDLKENEQKIKHHGQRAEDIVKGMLQHSRTNSGERVLTGINKLADEYLRLSYHGMRAKDKSFNVEFKTDFDLNLPKITVVPQDIGRVLLNLINNAFQAVHEKSKNAVERYDPEVVVSTKIQDTSIEISVRDNGPGIPDNIKDKIFQPFFTTKPTGSGTGLGLSLSYDIVKAHGGEIKVKSEEGKGTEFIIDLISIE